jgi:hypothetical protein
MERRNGYYDDLEGNCKRNCETCEYIICRISPAYKQLTTGDE